jgi:hypothetical protein
MSRNTGDEKQVNKLCNDFDQFEYPDQQTSGSGFRFRFFTTGIQTYLFINFWAGVGLVVGCSCNYESVQNFLWVNNSKFHPCNFPCILVNSGLWIRIDLNSNPDPALNRIHKVIAYGSNAYPDQQQTCML